MFKSAFLLLLAAAPGVAPHQQLTDQRRAFEARREGRILPLKEIERRVIPGMAGAQYLGFDFDAGPAVYTLKFLRDGRLIWVDVDGRTGAVVGRHGR